MIIKLEIYFGGNGCYLTKDDAISSMMSLKDNWKS